MRKSKTFGGNEMKEWGYFDYQFPPEEEEEKEKLIKIGSIIEQKESNDVIRKFKVRRRYFKRNRIFFEEI